MWRTFEIQILGWEEPEVVAEGGQFKQKSKLLLQNMLIIGEDALVGGQIIMASAMVISSKKALNIGVGDQSSQQPVFASECILSSLQKMFVCHL